jgi:acyl carrier protein
MQRNGKPLIEQHSATNHPVLSHFLTADERVRDVESLRKSGKFGRYTDAVWLRGIQFFFCGFRIQLLLARIFNHLKHIKMSEIAKKVTAIIVDKLGVDEGEVTREASFTNDLGADSLDTVELIMEFEKEFNIAIPDDQAEKIATVGQAIDYIEANAK